MSRAVFLPSPGDPYVLLQCLKYFYNVWEPEIDKLYININSDIEKSVIFKLLEVLNHPKMVISFTGKTGNHGESLDMMLAQCSEDYIMFVEDDGIVYKKGIIDLAFSFLELNEYDIIGSPRMSCSPEIAQIAKEKFNLNYEGYGDQGPAFWPCFFWTTKDILKRTDRNFGGFSLPKGHKLFKQILKGDVAGDTLVWTSLQLRNMDLRIREIPQCHCNPKDLSFQKNKENKGIFWKKCGYLHFGSLSSGIGTTLLSNELKPLKERTKDVPAISLKKLNSLNEKLELERRLMWWRKAYFDNQNLFYVPGFSEEYKHSIEYLMNFYYISNNKLNKWEKLYMDIIND